MILSFNVYVFSLKLYLYINICVSVFWCGCWIKANIFINMSHGRKLKHWVKKGRTEGFAWIWGGIKQFYFGFCRPSVNPSRQPLRSLKIVKNPHKPHKQSSVYQLMSLKLICISWMGHFSVMFLTCRMNYFIIKYSCWILCCIIKNQEILGFHYSFHLIYKNAWFPKLYFSYAFYLLFLF